MNAGAFVPGCRTPDGAACRAFWLWTAADRVPLALLGLASLVEGCLDLDFVGTARFVAAGLLIDLDDFRWVAELACFREEDFAITRLTDLLFLVILAMGCSDLCRRSLDQHPRCAVAESQPFSAMIHADDTQTPLAGSW